MLWMVTHPRTQLIKHSLTSKVDPCDCYHVATSLTTFEISTGEVFNSSNEVRDVRRTNAPFIQGAFSSSSSTAAIVVLRRLSKGIYEKYRTSVYQL